MAPVYVRGDVAFVWNWPGEIKQGDIVLFKPQTGSLAGQWTMHRIVGQDTDGNYLTRGDGATATDQQDGLSGPVSREDVAARALTIGDMPLKIPWFGTFALKLDTSRSSLQRYLVVGALTLIVGVGLFEVARQSRRHRRGQEVDPRLVFVAVGAIVSVLLIAMTLYQTVRVTLIYDVGPTPGIIMGQPVGILAPGEVVRKELSQLSNKGFLPMILLLTERDANVTADVYTAILPPRTERKVHIEVRGDEIGQYQSLIELSLVFPLLPVKVIGWLSNANHWLGALVGCVLPGMCIMVFGLLEPTARRRTRRNLRDFERWLSRSLGL